VIKSTYVFLCTTSSELTALARVEEGVHLKMNTCSLMVMSFIDELSLERSFSCLCRLALLVTMNVPPRASLCTDGKNEGGYKQQTSILMITNSNEQVTSDDR